MDGFRLASDKIYPINPRWNFQAQLSYSFTKFGKPYNWYDTREAGYIHVGNLLGGLRYNISHEERKVCVCVIVLAGLSGGIDKHKPINAASYNHRVPLLGTNVAVNFRIKKHFNFEIAADSHTNTFFKIGYML